MSINSVKAEGVCNANRYTTALVKVNQTYFVLAAMN